MQNTYRSITRLVASNIPGTLILGVSDSEDAVLTTPEEYKSIKVYQKDCDLFIEGEGQLNSSINIGGVYMNSSGRGVSISQVNGATVITGNGNVVINGKKINLNDYEDEPQKVIKIAVAIPRECDVDISDVDEIESKAEIYALNLDLTGSSKAVFKGYHRDVDINVSGVGNIEVQNVEGQLTVDSSGTASVAVSLNNSSHVRINSSGTSKINTNGHVKGNYSVNSSGMGSVSHYGTIDGKVKERSFGMAQINLPK